MSDLNILSAAEAEAFAMAEKARIARNTLRARIARDAGDQPSLIGTTNDIATLALVRLLQLATALSSAQTLADVRQGASAIAAIGADLLADLAAGQVTLPCIEKGDGAVLAEMAERGGAIAAVLADAQG